MNVPMKDSGVEWLGEVPAHWDVVRGSAVFIECTAKNDPLVSEDYLSLMANIGIIPYEEKGDVGNKKPEDVRKCKLVEPGDFVLNSMNYAIGSYGVSKYAGVCSPVYVVMKHRPEVADPKFLDLILSNPSYQNYAQSFGTGILDHRRAIGWDEIKVIRVPLPPLNEQAQIAAWAISRRDRIDTLVAKKTRFIELLREKRQALITHAVTKGLDPNVPMKDSGTASGLKLPRHWNVKNFWTVARQVSRSGHQDVGLMSVYLDRGVIPYSEGGGLVHKPSESLDAYQLVEPGNFVLNNQQAWRGSVGVSKHRGIVSPAYLVFELSEDLDPDFANYQFRETRFVEEMMLSSQGVGDIQRQVKWPLLRFTKVFLPPIEEQREIVANLDRATTRIDTLIAKTERSIELLREHRTALITAAVTGKLDLRPAA